MAVLFGTSTVGLSMATGAIFSTAVRNYPGQKGLVVGLVKAYVGIGAGVFTQLYVGFIGKPSSSIETGINFILYLALVSIGVCVASSALLVTFPDPPEGEGLTSMMQLRL